MNVDADYVKETNDPSFTEISSGSISCPPSKIIPRSSLKALGKGIDTEIISCYLCRIIGLRE